MYPQIRLQPPLLNRSFWSSSSPPPSQIQRKARTIMRQVDKNGDGKLSLAEFHVISRKFPNLLWPPTE